MKQFFSLLLSVLTITSYAQDQQISVLFLGNSYTATSLPTAFYNLAAAGGDTVYYERNTPGGYRLSQHATNATSLGKIASRDWDFVVMQEQSQLPSFGEAQVASQVFPFAEILVDSIRSNYECTEPVFYMTWGRKNGDVDNCPGFPALCTYEGMQERLRNAYLEMTFNNNATVAPCGAAWQQMKLNNTQFFNGLYTGDGSHPSAWGTYLNACVFYATILRKSPVGLDYYSSIGETDAVVLQQLAEDLVLDSLDNWNIGHADVVANANFENTVAYTVEFVSNSDNAINHVWDFGDGTFGTESITSHVYSTGNTYEVEYIASSECDADTITFQVSPSPNSIDKNNLFDKIEVVQQYDLLEIKNTLNEALSAKLIDLTGRVIVNELVISNSSYTVQLPSHSTVYLLQISDGQRQSTKKVILQ